MFLFRLKCIAT